MQTPDTLKPCQPKHKCFVVMPFMEPWSDWVYNTVRAALTEPADRAPIPDHRDGAGGRAVEWEVIRADVQPQIGRMMGSVRRMIGEADLIVADVTGGNPNVMYEVGAAHEQSKVVVLLYQPGPKPPPVDIADQLRIHYGAHDQKGLEVQLRKQIGDLVASGRIGPAREFWRLKPEVPTTVSVSHKPHGPSQGEVVVRAEVAHALMRLMSSPVLAECPKSLRLESTPWSADNEGNHVAIGGPATNGAVCAGDEAGVGRGPVRFEHHQLVWPGKRVGERDAHRTAIISREVSEGGCEFTVQGLHAPETKWAVRACVDNGFWRYLFGRCPSLRTHVLDLRKSLWIAVRAKEDCVPDGDVEPEEFLVAVGCEGRYRNDATCARLRPAGVPLLDAVRHLWPWTQEGR